MSKAVRKPKFAGIQPKFHKKSVQQYVDYDYTDKLSDKEKAWLAKFSDEFYGARFVGEESEHLHTSKEQKKAVYNANNARNRDIMCVKANSVTHFLDEITEEDDGFNQ